MAEKEYIEREAATSELRKWNFTADRPRTWMNAVDKAIEVVESIPAADVRPVVRGRWNRTDAYPHRLYCSACYKTYLKNDELLERLEVPLNFCPNCGADMREES